MNAYVRVSIPAAARNLIALFFIITAYLELAEMVQHPEATGVAWWPMLVKGVIILAELAGGWLLVIGWKARPVSVLLAALTLANAVACIAAAAETYLPTHLLKDLALIGSLLQVASFGPGMFSVDHDASVSRRLRSAPHT